MSGESTLLPIYKNEGDMIQSCTNYRGIKLMCHKMKLWERVIDARLRRLINISKNQFGFMPGRSTTEAIHLLQQLMKSYRERGNIRKDLETKRLTEVLRKGRVSWRRLILAIDPT